jgi:hypothetical protein
MFAQRLTMFAQTSKAQAGQATLNERRDAAEQAERDYVRRCEADAQRQRDEREYRQIHELLVAIAPTVRKYRALREKLIAAYPDASIVGTELNW